MLLPPTRTLSPAFFAGQGLVGDGVGDAGGLAVGEGDFGRELLALDVVMEDALAIDEDDEGGLAAIVEGEQFLELVRLDVGELGIEVPQGDSGAVGVWRVGVGH